MSVLARFALDKVDAQLTIRETQTRDTIKHGKRTIAYVGIARELWGEELVHRFNTHTELLNALRDLLDTVTGDFPADLIDRCQAAIAKAEGRS